MRCAPQLGIRRLGIYLWMGCDGLPLHQYRYYPSHRSEGDSVLVYGRYSSFFAGCHPERCMCPDNTDGICYQMK